MLLPEDVHPEQSIFYNGAIVLQSLQGAGESLVGDLFIDVHGRTKMSFPVFVLSLDWLYLIGCAELNEAGKIYPCS